MAIAATNTSVDVIRGTLLPGTHLFQNFSNLVAGTPLGIAMKNSLVNATSLTILSLVICSIAGYGFEIFHTKGKDVVMNILLLAMMIPFASTMIPLFRMFGQMGLVGSTVAVILPTISTPFLIMLFRQSSRDFPHEIIEAARIDGLNEIMIFFRLFIPTMKSTYSAAAVITFMGAWNNYLWPRVILLQKETMTMPMLISNLKAGYVTDYGMLMLAVLICTLPTVVIFFFFQKSFAEGISGSVK
jgi:lactose/L-arabinose transport system permease protein